MIANTEFNCMYEVTTVQNKITSSVGKSKPLFHLKDFANE